MSTINRKPKGAAPATATDTTPEMENFIDSAPDGAKGRKGVVKGKKLQISLTVEADILEQVDSMAAKQGLSRASLINLAIRQVLSKGATIGDD